MNNLAEETKPQNPSMAQILQTIRGVITDDKQATLELTDAIEENNGDILELSDNFAINAEEDVLSKIDHVLGASNSVNNNLDLDEKNAAQPQEQTKPAFTNLSNILSNSQNTLTENKVKSASDLTALENSSTDREKVERKVKDSNDSAILTASPAPSAPKVKIEHKVRDSSDSGIFEASPDPSAAKVKIDTKVKDSADSGIFEDLSLSTANNTAKAKVNNKSKDDDSSGIFEVSSASDDVNDVTGKIELDRSMVAKPNLLISEQSAVETSQAIKSFIKTVAKPLTDGLSFRSGTTVEDLVVEMMKPYLKEWLDKNLPNIVKQIVEKEIHKLIPDKED